MISRILMILLTAMAVSFCGQTKTEIKDIDNTLTDKHINIPGTRLYIVPPPGFKTASSFVGLVRDNNSAFQVYDLVGGNFYTNAATFSREKFENKGATVFDYKVFKVNGFPAKYCFMQGDSKAKAISLVFGDTTFSTMMMVLYPSGEDKTGEEIQAAIKTIYYDKNLKTDPFANASFTFDESKSVFKFAKSSAGMFMYSIGGVNKKSYDNESFITVIQLPNDETMSAKDISDMFVSKLEKYGLTDKEVKNSSTADVNGQAAYEVEIYGKMKGKSSVVYQLIVILNNKAIAIQGMVQAGAEKDLEEIKKLAKTIKLK